MTNCVNHGHLILGYSLGFNGTTIIRRLRIILSYLHFFSKSSLELICSRIFWIFLQFQWLRDTTSRFKDIQQNILSCVLFSETFYRISTQHSFCSSVCCCMSRESSSLIGRAGDTPVGL